jgi:hypothetical protein
VCGPPPRRIGSFYRRIQSGADDGLFSFLLLAHLLDLAPLILYLLLLLLKLALRLLVRYFLILHFIANHIAAARSQSATNSRACSGMANSSADYRARAGSQQSPNASSFFAFRKRLPGASTDQQDRRQGQCCGG